ncbi:MAG: phosphatase PAP2 family protein [Bacteroidales bacterium]|nr:phosphatase PAP2 family protein [Bacteroidales bacterium]
MNLDGIIQIDQQITLWLNHFHTPETDSFWMLFSDVKVWYPAYLAVAAVLVYRLGWKKGLAVVLALALTVALVDQSSAHIKDTLGRLRPCYTTWMLDNGLHWPMNRYNFFGFFSGHASNTFAVAVVSYLGFRTDASRTYRTYGICVFLWAALVSLSRIMMGMHYFGDVCVGILYGLAMGMVIGTLLRGILSKVRG